MGAIHAFLRSPSDARSASVANTSTAIALSSVSHMVKASGRPRSGCEPSSTSSTPAMISAMPAAMAQVSGSRNRAAPSTAVRAVPIAPQIP